MPSLVPILNEHMYLSGLWSSVDLRRSFKRLILEQLIQNYILDSISTS